MQFGFCRLVMVFDADSAIRNDEGSARQIWSAAAESRLCGTATPLWISFPLIPHRNPKRCRRFALPAHSKITVVARSARCEVLIRKSPSYLANLPGYGPRWIINKKRPWNPGSSRRVFLTTYAGRKRFDLRRRFRLSGGFGLNFSLRDVGYLIIRLAHNECGSHGGHSDQNDKCKKER